MPTTETATERLRRITDDRLVLPLIAAPMFGVSGPALASASCRAGVIGSLPTHNAESSSQLDEWLAQIGEECDVVRDDGRTPAPLAPNLIVHKSNPRLDDDLNCLVRHGIEIVIASVGSPEQVVEGLHAADVLVFADVASLRHVDRALAAGVDGLILLSAGAGGQTGWANPLAFVRAVRDVFEGPITLAGGLSDGAALWASLVAGCDLGYMGTRFIAAEESLADDAYRELLIKSSLDDITTTTELTGIPANVIRSSLAAAEAAGPPTTGFDNDLLHAERGGVRAAGHTVGRVRETLSCAALITQIAEEFNAAQTRSQELSARLTPKTR
ncbi:MAG TPA: nitronate monooxygenase [Nonomuraea sp.]|nr:nitronate monooxygenase [Nonomuraea sp.]